MKHQFGLIVAVAIVVDLAAFAGIGFGSGALSLSSPPPAAQYSESNYSTLQSQMTFAVHFATVEQGGQLITGMLAGGQSTSLTFDMTLTFQNPTSCANGGDPAWDGDATNGPTDGYYHIHFPQAVTGTIDGSPVTGSDWFIAQNATGASYNDPLLSYCLFNGAGDTTKGPVGLIWQHTIVLTGLYPVMSMSISLYIQGQYCSGPIGGTRTGVCGALNGNLYTNSGNFNGFASAGATWQSAGASFSTINPQLNYNGGTVTVSINTGYDGPAQYSIEIDCPSVRPCGGTVDTSFANNPITIPNFCTGCVRQWSIPSTANQNSTYGTAWNTWQIVLKATFVNQQISALVIINPLYSPTTPTITYSTSSGLLYPAIEDTVTLTVYSNATAFSGAVTSITLLAFYLPPGATSISGPACGNQWITTCPGGSFILISQNGNNAVGTFSFVVNPPVGNSQIGFEAIAGTVNGQPSSIGSYLLQIKSAGCIPGNPCDPLRGGQTFWQIAGPILLSAAFILIGILAAIYVGPPKLRMLIIAAPIVLVAILYLFGGYAAWFAHGGIFNSTGPGLH